MNGPLLERRKLMQLLIAGVAVPLLPAAEPNAPLFFDRGQYALLDHLTEMIIPQDSHSGGARAAGVAPFIDRMVAEAFTAEEKDSWRKGLALVDQSAQTQYKKPFMALPKPKQVAILKKMSNKPEGEPGRAGHQFFEQLKQTTAFVYYSSSLGIHQEIEYKGNVLLPQFVGYDAT